MGKEVMLRVDNVNLSFGKVRPLVDVSLGSKQKRCWLSSAPNGAGKTCLFNCTNEFFRPQEGVPILVNCVRLRSERSRWEEKL